MLVVVPAMAIFLLFKRNFGTEDHSGELGAAKLLVLSALIGMGVGMYDGFFGPGTGTFLMLAYSGICKFDLLKASGNTKAANSASNLASMITFALAGKVGRQLCQQSGIPDYLRPCGEGNVVGGHSRRYLRHCGQLCGLRSGTEKGDRKSVV